MKLFLKDHLPLVFFYLAQMLFVPGLYWLTGDSRPPSVMLYGMLLAGVVLLLYLVFRYMQQRLLYQKLSHTGDADNLLDPLGEAAVPEAVSRLLHTADRHYREQLDLRIRTMDRHVDFIGRWVHQMKTPLSVIQLTLEDVDEAAAASIQEELERLRKGLEMVIYTSRLERFEDDFQVESLPLREMASKAVAENRKLFIRRGIRAEISIDPGLAVYSDAKWLLFMLTQILVNAVNYTPGSGKTVSITARSGADGTMMEIRDEGIGISPADLKRVFNPYFTGERGRQYHESTGMGLYLVREICKRLGHRVELESRLGEGTAVRIYFSENT